MLVIDSKENALKAAITLSEYLKNDNCCVGCDKSMGRIITCLGG